MAVSAGTRLGPYEVIESVGVGGMGEVYRARDPRLGRDVALKVLRPEAASDPERLRRFECEAHAVAALNHPNILTVHDVGTHDGVPYVVTELLEGEDFRELAARRVPTVRQILSWALQAARGLEAAHAKGIVHRDLKPENLFLTSDGRVKVLDFGLAKLMAADPPAPASSTAPGRVVGTVAYMSPEQALGHPVDARSDVFSFGVVLFELLARKHPFRRDTAAATLTAIVEQTPVDLESLSRGIPPAVGGIVRRCLEKGREERYGSGHDVVVALEPVLAAPSGAAALLEVEERSPYPGLQSFTERDAGVFFGREREVEELWARIRSRRLLAVIGPSGAGKTSFVRAGVIACRPQGWAAVCATPGANPGLGLARALTPDLAGDAEAIGDLLTGVAELSQTGEAERVVAAAKRWRSGYDEALLLMDQFEELFTLNPPQTQARIAALLGRVVSEADVHVVLSMRDDFLIRCSDHERLAPVFESLTPLTTLSRDGLCRAVVEPARKRGYRLEDDALVDEIVSTVDGARGALPLLAFAVARLWEKRDRERKLLTREAYREIAGVEGALAQHAEATMDGIGSERQGLVREIFRNLVTAHGTRAVCDREELLSAFPDRLGAEDILRQLIDARLLTSYEVEGREGEASHHRIEIVHESLLRAWPRLVRWQAQDEEGAVLRDQLRQAAHLWEEKGRTSDLLWMGTAYREFELWRERYPGALTALEEDFVRSMADKAKRRKRRLRLAAGASFLALVAIAITIGVSRQQAVRSRDRAEAEALRAEAGKLLALGRTHIDADLTAALAYARASLELFDTPEARTFALEALWLGPVARILPVELMIRGLPLLEDPSPIAEIAFSPDGRWLATRSGGNRRVLIFPRDGRPARALPRPPDGNAMLLEFSPRGDLLITGGSGESVRFWSLPDLREVRSAELGGRGSFGLVRGPRLLTFTWMHEEDAELLLRAWPLRGGDPQVLGPRAPRWSWWDIDPGGTTLAHPRGRTVRVVPLDPSRSSGERILGQSRDDLLSVAFAPGGGRLAALDRSGEIRIWPTAGDAAGPLRVLHGPRYEGAFLLRFDPQGRLLTQAGPNNTVLLWDLDGPPEAQPVAVGRAGPAVSIMGAFDPRGPWLALAYGLDTVEFWPLGLPRPRVLHGFASTVWSMAFTKDSRWLATCSMGEPARVWPLNAVDGSAHDLVPPEPCISLAMHPSGREVLVGTRDGRALLISSGQGPARRLLDGWGGPGMTSPVAIDPRGRWAAACPYTGGIGFKDPERRVFRVWDLQSAQESVYSVAHLTDANWDGFGFLAFAPDGRLYVGRHGVSRLVLPREPGGAVSSETVFRAGDSRAVLSEDGRLLAVLASESRATHTMQFEEMHVLDLERHTSRRITTHGARLSAVALDPSARVVVTGDTEGVVRVGPVSGEEPHLLLGHEGLVTSLAVSPDGRWIASATEESIRLWPLPDVTKPPLHTLPHAELIAKLDTLTNLRVVRDPTSSTGWTFEIGPFPGWKDVPTW